MNLHEAMTQARTLLLEGLRDHEQTCGNPAACREKANALAYLAHSIGATKDDLDAFPGLLVRYDLDCKNSGGCDAHEGGLDLGRRRIDDDQD